MYLQYNMHPWMRCIEIEKKIEKTLARLIHFDFRYYSDDLDPILDWVRIAENLNDPLLMRQDLFTPLSFKYCSNTKGGGTIGSQGMDQYEKEMHPILGCGQISDSQSSKGQDRT